MPNFPWPHRRDESEISDASLAALLAGTQSPDDVPADLRPAMDVLAALQAGPGGDELAGETAALAEYRRRTGTASAQRRARRRAGRPASRRASRPAGCRADRAVLPSLGGKVAAAAAAAAIGIGGVAAVTIGGVLPASFQRAIHDTIPTFPLGAGATTQARHARPARPGQHLGRAALCGAYARAQADGSPRQADRVRREIAAAAGGADRVAAFCAQPRQHPAVPAPAVHRARGRCAPLAPFPPSTRMPARPASVKASCGPGRRWPRTPGHLLHHRPGWLVPPGEPTPGNPPPGKPLHGKPLHGKLSPGKSHSIKIGRPGRVPVRKLVTPDGRGFVPRHAPAPRSGGHPART